MTETPRLPLPDITAIARDVAHRHQHELIGTVPAEGDSDYVEVVLAPSAESTAYTGRLSIGVHRAESAQSIRDQIERQMTAR